MIGKRKRRRWQLARVNLGECCRLAGRAARARVARQRAAARYNARMFRLTREVRFAINPTPDDDEQLARSPSNSYGGYPSLTGIGHYFAARVTLAGDVDPGSQYLINIKRIDQAVRDALPAVERAVRGGTTPAALLTLLFELLRPRWPSQLVELALGLTPLMSVSIRTSEYPMMRLSQKFEFSATHRLHNPALSEEENRRTFGKCNNPLGHGHNYEVQVTLVGTPGDRGTLADVPAFERIVAETVIEKFDHKNLNAEVPQFREVIPSVENIAKVIYELLTPRLQGDGARLASVTVWETPKTWCEYTE
jgi:6-pyruvoyltetrahydropterin/6-carboxytetrahydropterin synthase